MLNSNKLTIRKGLPADIPQVLALIRELAEYERAAGEVEVSEQELLEDGFGHDSAYGLFVAEAEKDIVGIALYYEKYSTWKGRCLFLEDLVVRESFRSMGIGSRLFDKVVEVAKEKNYRRLEWQVLEWNEPAIAFYRKKGAILDPEWINGKLTYSQLQLFETGV